MATNTSRRFASLSNIFFVSVGMIAKSGCLQMGVKVPIKFYIEINEMLRMSINKLKIRTNICANIKINYHHSLEGVLT